MNISLSSIKKILIRYGPAEVFSTIGAFAGAFAAAQSGAGILIIAGSSTMGENVGYYGYTTIHEIYIQIKKDPNLRHNKFSLAWKTIRNQLFEFAPAEIVDTFFVRPGLTILGISLSGNLVLGVLFGKIVADILYYLIVFVSLKIRRRTLGE